VREGRAPSRAPLRVPHACEAVGINITTVAHIPNVNGYNPLVPEYGDAKIVAQPSRPSSSFATLDAAIAAAKVESNDMDTAAAVFQSTSGAFLLGLALHDLSDGPEELVFGPEIAKRIVFDDASLVALVSGDTVATRATSAPNGAPTA